MAEIRWDTIMSRPPDSAPGIATAAGLMNNGFSALQNVLKQNETVQNQNFDNHTKLNTAAFQDAVAKYRSPEELKAAMDNGELDKLRSSLGPNIDHDAIRGVADQRLTGLMQQKQQDIMYQHIVTDERVAPLAAAYKAGVLKGGPEGEAAARAAEAEYTKLGGRDLPGLLAYGDSRKQELVERTQKTGRYDMDIKQGNAQITHLRNADANDAARTANDRQRLAYEGENMGYARETRMAVQNAANLERMAKFAGNSAGSEMGQAKINDYIDKIKDPDIQTNARAAAAKLMKDGVVDPKTGKKIEATVGSVLAAISTVDKRDWFAHGDMLWSNSNAIDDAVEQGKAQLQSRAAVDFQRRQEVGYDAARKDYEASNARLEAVRQRLDAQYGSGAKK